MRDSQVVIGTRGSSLALAQTDIVARLLKKKNPGLQISVNKILTEGDIAWRFKRANETGKDLFTKKIDEALLLKDIDLAVHSLKDVAVENSGRGLEIAAYPRREDPSDVLVSNRGYSYDSLPKGAKVGTSSVRRAIQLETWRNDLKIVEIHGNIGTRITKLKDSGLDAIVLARAGLKRLGIGALGKKIPLRIMLPAVGQGCLAISIRKNDRRIREIVELVDDSNTRTAVTAERAFSRYFGGGCNTPIAAYARVRGGRIELEGMVKKSNRESSRVIRSKISGPRESPVRLGRLLAARLNSNKIG